MTTTADVPVPAGGEPPQVLLELTIQREPMPAPRPRSTSRGPAVFMPDGYTAERDALKLIMRSAMRGQPTTGPCRIVVTFVRSRRTKGDIDNLLKTLMDAGNGVLYDDDAQVFEARARIRWGTPGRTELRLERIDAGEVVA